MFGLFDDDEDEAAVPAGGLTSGQKSELEASLAAKYAAASDPTKLRDAESRASRDNTIDGLAEAFMDHGNHGLAARGLKVQKSDFFDQQKKETAASLDRARQGQRDEIDRVVTGDRLARRGTEEARQDSDWQRKVASTGQEDDPTSAVSRRYQELASQLLPGKDFSGDSATTLKERIGVMKEMYEVSERKKATTGKVAKVDDRPYEYEDEEGHTRVGRYVEGKGLVQTASDPVTKRKKLGQSELPHDDKMSKLTSDQRARFDNSTMALKAAEDMSSALLVDNENTFSLVGDNNYTMARTKWEEALGRMQSGGAINDEEADRFRQMAPTSTDSSEIQKKKLREMQALMTQRISNLGMDPAASMAEVRATEEGISLPGEKPDDGTAIAAPGSKVKPPKGMVQIMAPDGSIRAVPADQVEKYKAKGGKVVK